ncbi:hypothetical protein J2X36_001131 [Methylobacterium sp. BE186]|uniref:hypothetical protein n=1 Tax=Methylobacterium sp. BE186 TaxID=2817715 RepID=UPI0028632804|nr:hypothetical protein [Methylobacterium sp. BE186]MDR7036393.1 hypothetical protein [Methylobacterium sp. BE186]
MPRALYSIGPPIRPKIRHDNGFLDQYQKRAPSLGDRKMLARWKLLLEAAEAGQNVPFLPHNDVPDALAAYRHFLEGSGRTRRIGYERYLRDDPSGRITLDNMIRDAREGAVGLYERSFPRRDASFSMTSTALAAGGTQSPFPYPQTENWQKAIGAHNFWISADVIVSAHPAYPVYEMTMTIHVEDMYNFNPGAQDIATGIPDDANGLFEITGLAQQYLNVAEVQRHVAWRGSAVAAARVTLADTSRQRRPSDNRRLRNRL